MFDRYLAASSVVSVDSLQLIAIACLHLAENLEDNGRVRAYNFYGMVQEKYDEAEIHNQEMEIGMTLKFKLRAPTIISWANRLCKQWDLWIAIENRDIDVMFKDSGNKEVPFVVYLELYQLEGLDSVHRLRSA